MWLRLLLKPVLPLHLFGLDDALVGALGGSLISGLFGKSGQDSANSTNIALGREQMAFQERMSNTSYQRAVKDMQEAGLNPMLAYSQGGASAPVGSMPQVQNANSAGIASAAQGAQIAQAVQSLLQSQANVDLIGAQADKVRSETIEHSINSARASAELEAAQGEAMSKKHLGLVDMNLFPDRVERYRWETGRERLGYKREEDTFAADVARRKAESAISQYGVAGAKSESDFWEKMGSAPKEVKFFLDLMRQVFGIRNSIKR